MRGGGYLQNFSISITLLHPDARRAAWRLFKAVAFRGLSPAIPLRMRDVSASHGRLTRCCIGQADEGRRGSQTPLAEFCAWWRARAVVW